MTKPSAALAVRLRQAQWLLDELAFDAGAGRLDARRITEAAITLTHLSTLLTSIHLALADEHPAITPEVEP